MVPRFFRGFFLALSIIACSAVAFAGKTELATGYPSPYGEYTNLKSAADSFFATSSGNVGIGTTTAISKLDVRGTLSVGNAATAGAIGKVQITTDGASPINNRLTFGTDGLGWKFAIGKNQGGTVTEYMTFQDTPFNVGIGTTNPTVKLEVAGTIRSTRPYWSGQLSGGAITNAYQGLVAVESSGVTLTGGNTLNIPTTGLYLIHVRQLVQNAAGIYLQLRVNGGGGFKNPISPVGFQDLQMTIVWPLNAGDRIQFYYTNAATNTWGGAHSEAYVVMVSGDHGTWGG